MGVGGARALVSGVSGRGPTPVPGSNCAAHHHCTSTAKASSRLYGAQYLYVRGRPVLRQRRARSRVSGAPPASIVHNIAQALQLPGQSSSGPTRLPLDASARTSRPGPCRRAVHGHALAFLFLRIEIEDHVIRISSAKRRVVPPSAKGHREFRAARRRWPAMRCGVERAGGTRSTCTTRLCSGETIRLLLRSVLRGRATSKPTKRP
jgi:hypothetical protein